MLISRPGLTCQGCISVQCSLYSRYFLGRVYGFLTLLTHRYIFSYNPDHPPGVLCHRGDHIQRLHRLRHTNDDWRGAQVLYQPGGIHFRLAQSLPGHRNPVHVHPATHRK